jgi:hypothetical protein
MPSDPTYWVLVNEVYSCHPLVGGVDGMVACGGFTLRPIVVAGDMDIPWEDDAFVEAENIDCEGSRQQDGIITDIIEVDAFSVI